ncbi:MAG TPA: PASTA domain-containing protein [Polyangia bacterium]|jgi:hypothetical protein
MWKTFARTTACLAVSAAAIIAATRMDASAAAPRKSGGADSTESKPAPTPRTRKSAPPKPAPAPEPKLTVASLATKSPFAEPPASTATAVRKDDAALVTVPDWKGKRLSVVRREARKLGLNVTGTTGDGDTVAAVEASDYRVRKQLVEAGSEVAPGTDIPVRVRMTVEAAEGY